MAQKSFFKKALLGAFAGLASNQIYNSSNFQFPKVAYAENVSEGGFSAILEKFGGNGGKPFPDYSRNVFDFKKSCLLVIDMANFNCKLGAGFYKDYPKFEDLPQDFKFLFGELETEVVPNIKTLIDFYRKNNFEVLYTTIESLSLDGRESSLDYKCSQMLVPKGSYESKVIDELAPIQNEIQIPKTSCDIFQSTNLDYVLKNIGVEYLVIVGVNTNQCVSGAVRSAADRGYYVTLITDATTCHTEEAKINEIKTLAGFARIKTTEEFLDQF